MTETAQTGALDDALTAAREAVDTDSTYWETLAVGQDSQEAEASGYLAGYLDALEAVEAFFNGDPDRLSVIADVMRDTTQEQREEINAA